MANPTNPFTVSQARTVESLNLPKISIEMSKEKNRWPHLADLPLPPVKDVDITVLLGADVFDLIVPLEIRTGPKGTPRAVRTALGWTATSRLPVSSDINTVTAMKVHIATPEEDLSHQVQLRWKTESFGCKYVEETSRSVEDKKALEILESNPPPNILENATKPLSCGRRTILHCPIIALWPRCNSFRWKGD